MRKPEVCILPVAGLSTRNLPATKALHKGFLTLHSLPIIQYAVNACAEIGIKEVVFIYSDQSCKHLFESYFSPYPWLENHLREKNKLDLLKAVQEVIPAGMKFSFAEQAEPKGNGHAILMAKDVVGDRDFIVMWPDDVYINLHGDGVLKQLLDVYEKEPLPLDSPLLSMDNVTLMPHSAGITNDILKNSLKIIKTEFERFLKREPLKFTI